jgi:hypothetical protein
METEKKQKKQKLEKEAVEEKKEEEEKEEIWKTIKDARSYEVSTLGRIRRKSTKKIVEQFLQGEYLYVSLLANHRRTIFPVHMLVAYAFLPPPPE